MLLVMVLCSCPLCPTSPVTSASPARRVLSFAFLCYPQTGFAPAPHSCILGEPGVTVGSLT